MSVKRLTQLGALMVIGAACVCLPGRSAEPAVPEPAATNVVNPATNAPAAPQVVGDLLQFVDGASIHGRLRQMSSGGAVEWEHPDARIPIEFGPSNIAWIRFEKPRTVSTPGQPTCRFRFNNGDEVFGNLGAIEGDTVELETWFGGALKARRQALQSIIFLSKGFSILYEGPTSAEGWVHGKTPRNWEYRDGSFVANGAGTLGRDLKLSGSSSVAFDLSWNGHFSLILALYTPVLDRFDYSSSSYMFYLSPGYITLQRVQGGSGAMNLGQAQIPEMGRKTRLRIEIRSNKEDSTLSLLVDDRLVQRWKDTAGFVGQGSGIVFFAQLDGPSIKLSNMKVAQWEGQFGIEAATNAPSKDDLIYLVNKDKVTGKLQSIHNGAATVEAGQTALEIPVTRVTQISFGSASTNVPALNPWEMRAFFAGGGSVAFHLGQWRPTRLTGQSENFGPLELDPQSIRQLQFNLDRSKLTTDATAVPDEGVWDLE